MDVFTNGAGAAAGPLFWFWSAAMSADISAPPPDDGVAPIGVLGPDPLGTDCICPTALVWAFGAADWAGAAFLNPYEPGFDGELEVHPAISHLD